MPDRPTHADYLRRKQYYLAILQDHAPTGKAQQLVSDIFNHLEIEAQREAETEAEAVLYMERTLASILFDGLSYGNWPWIILSGEELTNGR